MNNWRRKLLLEFLILSACLCETVGCPQLLGNAFRDGTRTFLETGLTAALLGALDLESLGLSLFP